MTVTKEEPEIAVNGGLPVVTAVGIEEKADEKVSSAAGGGNQGPPIPAGHARFYCNKCRAPYDLPDGATTWRCAGCHTFNSTTPDECCTIL
mmetsp:Transcript_27698/g.46866  ORF Transcript_27698/g.46866 Transcript_27698/m.46866 type:complete len:91 (-) Transcript_27698:737-1009(-)